MTDRQTEPANPNLFVSHHQPVSSLLSMMGWDMKLQARYGIYAVYGILTVIFVIGLRAIDPSFRTDIAILLIVTDPAILGFYFIAALVLFEKSDGVLDSVVTSPLRGTGYLLSKVLTLSLLATVVSTIVAVVGHGASTRMLILIGGVLVSAPFFVLVGFVAVARFDSINEYFLSAVLWGTVLFVPIFEFLGIVSSPLFYVLPAKPVFILVEAGFRSTASWKLVYAVGYLLVANTVAYYWARKSFRNHIVRGGKPRRKLGHTKSQDSTWSHSSRTTGRSPWFGLVVADLKNWIRDPMLGIAAIGPLLLAVVVRFGVPLVTEMLSGVVDLETYYPVIAGSVIVFGPGIYGFIVGMFVLEDREWGIIDAFRVSPLTTRGYLLYRSLTVYIFGFAVTLPAMVVVDLVEAPLPVIVGSVAIGALSGPLIALGLGIIASNTIEGLALSKFANIVILGPAILIALIPEPFQFAAGLVPTYWPVKAFVAGVSGGSMWIPYVGAGLVVHVLAYVVINKRLISRIG